MANADSTAGSQVRTNQKSEFTLSDDLTVLITKAGSICGALRLTDGLPSRELENVMWAVQDMLKEADVIVCQLHNQYVELERRARAQEGAK